MDVEELNSINREVDDIIQLPPEPNPPPAHMLVSLQIFRDFYRALLIKFFQQ